MANFRYDLKFVARGSISKTPEIVFVICKSNWGELEKRVAQLVINNNEFESYFQNESVCFNHFLPNIFGDIDFGYNNCSYVTKGKNELCLRISLLPHPWIRYSVATIKILAQALSVPFSESSSNKTQLIEILTMAELRSGGHGHSVSGNISEEVVGWLKTYASEKLTSDNTMDMVSIHSAIIKASQIAWCAVTTKNLHEYSSETYLYGWIQNSGAFTINCPGNACDLSVYPDSLQSYSEGGVQLSCHNLDTAEQQLTLLSGLAMICSLVRESLK